MKGSIERPPIVIRQRRGGPRNRYYLSFAFFGLVALADLYGGGAGLWIDVVLGLLALLMLAVILWPMRLTARPTGIAINSVLRRGRLIPWSQVGLVRSATYLGSPWIGFDYAPGHERDGLTRQFSRQGAGIDRLLLGTPEGDLGRAVEALNAAREAWAGAVSMVGVETSAVAPAPAPILSRMGNVFAQFVVGRVTQRLYWIGFAVIAALLLAAWWLGWANMLSGAFTIAAVALMRGRFRDLGWGRVAAFLLPFGVVACGLAGAIVGVVVAPGQGLFGVWTGTILGAAVPVILIGAWPSKPVTDDYHATIAHF